MPVFPQSCIPLASNLRLTGPQCCESKPSSQEDSWRSLTELLVEAVSLGKSPDEISYDYDAASLFSPRLKGRSGKRLSWKKSQQGTLVNLLRDRTYWYKRLPRSGRNKVKKLLSTASGRSTLRECINTCDGVLLSLMFSNPESFTGGYAFSDRVTNCVLMNCFHNYSLFQKKLKQLRKTIKKQFLEDSHVEIPTEIARTFSFVGPLVKLLNTVVHKRSKSTIFRVATFSQTRATGLADAAMSEASVQAFLDEVTVAGSFEPNTDLTRARDLTNEFLATTTAVGQNPEFKVSISSSACFESSKKRGGKFEYAAEVMRKSGIRLPELSEGIPGTLGNLVHRMSMDFYLSPELHDKLLSVNVAAVRENGKARVVTSGSFWKEAALQPYSHATIHLIKALPNLRSGLQAAKLGWKFIEKVLPEEPRYEWIFSKGRKFIFSTDWEKATDRPTPQMAWWLVGDLLKRLGLPSERLEHVRFYWLGEKRLYYRGKHVGLLLKGIPMGDPLTKTCLSLAHPVCDLYARGKTHGLAVEEGNGDDTVAITDSKEYGEKHGEASRILGYSQSADDTFTTTDWGTYCEEWFHLPQSPSNTVKLAMKVGNYKLLPYLDVPKLRIVIGTAKDRLEFSSDITGKVTLMGKEESYVAKFRDGPYKLLSSFASVCQDICLATSDQPDPLHLPREIYGVGKAPPGWDAYTWKSIVHRSPPQKRKVYYHTLKVLNSGAGSLLPRGYAKENKHFGKDESWVDSRRIRHDDPIRSLIVVRADEVNSYPGTALMKLVSFGYLIPESKLLRYYMFQERLNELTLQKEESLFEKVAEQVASIDYGDITDEMIDVEVDDFIDRFHDRPYNLKQERYEDLYDFEAIKGLEEGNPLRVTDVEFPLLSRFVKRLPPSTLYEEEGEELYNWFVGARAQRAAGFEPDLPPPMVLDDDPLIIRQIALAETSHYFVVTDDMAMLRKAQRSVPAVTIIQISCYDLYKMTDKDFGNTEEIISQIMPMFDCTWEDVTLLTDTGSMETFLRQHERRGDFIRYVDGIDWNKSVNRAHFSMKVLKRPISDSKLTAINCGYPQKGFAYRRRK